METDPARWVVALKNSHARLRTLVEPLDEDDLRRQSYASEWSIAQVLSHLGSGAEIFEFFVDAGLTGSGPPGREEFEPIWAAWNALEPLQVARDALASDAGLIGRISALDEQELDHFELSAFGMDIDAVSLMRMRLSEHALHTWDIEVALDSAAVVSRDAVALLVDALEGIAARTGKPTGDPQQIRVITIAPERAFDLVIDEAVTLTPAGANNALPEIELPSEQLIRLVYGRLDPEHTGDVRTDGVDLDAIRSVFPGI